MKRELIHWRWLTALSLASACGDDGAVNTSGDTDTDTEGTGDDDGPSTVTLTTSQTTTATTDPDDSGSSSESTGTDPDSSSTAATEPTSADSSESSTTGEPLDCGNGVVDAGEVCDGDELDGESCVTQGHVAGALACDADCMGFDESACVDMVCGDDMVDGTEECDGTDLGLTPTCEDLGYDAGTLACNEDTCEYEETGCITFSCGDGAINGAKEQCDGMAFGGETCESQNAGTGNLACTANCQIDTSPCCGSNSIGPMEACDGTDVGGQTCADQGDFDGGVLGCQNDCSDFDVAGCTLCGDAVAEGDESCDMADLNGADCTTVPGGFEGGTLGCSATCDFDTTGCNFCGNGVVDPNPPEECDGADLDDMTCLDLGHTGGTLACDASCGLDDSACTDVPNPAAGELFITEIMQNPSVVPDPGGEWFEIHNPSMADTYQLLGCTVEGGGVGEVFVIETELLVGPGEFVTFAGSLTPGFMDPDFVWDSADFTLTNDTDTVRLVCNAVTVDEVSYDDGATFPDPDGASMTLDIGFFDALQNDFGVNWCSGLTDQGNGDDGTPGATNDDCAAPTFDIDFCNLQFPETINEVEGETVTIFGRVFIQGLTDQSPTNNTTPNVDAFVGYGPNDTAPSDATWMWFPATANPAWVGVGIPDANNDEYMGDIVVPASGTYDYAVRFTGDNGLTFTYCDTDGTSSTDPYEIPEAGDMTSVDGPSPNALYISEYVEGSGNNKAIEVYNPGSEGVYFGQCNLRVYSNGAVMPSQTMSFPTSGIPAGDVLVVCNTVAGAQLNPLCDQFRGGINFTGDDAVELVCNGTTLDVIGQIGTDPGEEWTGGMPVVGTGEETLRRSCAVTDGDPIGNDAFDPSIEWQSFVQNTFTGLGTRGCP